MKPPSSSVKAKVSLETLPIRATIGDLACNCSNNESLLAVVMQMLLSTDRTGSILVFGTLNTTRARIDLIRRLSKARLANDELGQRLETLLRQFERSNKVRNDILHSMFVLDEDGRIIETQAMRIDDSRGQVRFGEIKPFDEARIVGIRRELNRMVEWNGAMWSLIADLEVRMAPIKSLRCGEPAATIGEAHDRRT